MTYNYQPDEDGYRFCAYHSHWLPLTEEFFYNHRNGGNYKFERRCKQANRDQAKKRWDETRRAELYNLPLDGYERMMEEQGGGCAICGRTDQALCVDHCHTTEAVRGLLCKMCNTAISFLKDDPHLLFIAAYYLIKARK